MNKGLIKNNKKLLYLTVIVLVLLLLNLFGDTSFEIPLTPSSDKVTSDKQILLDKGSYSVTLSAKGSGEAGFKIVSPEHGDVYKGKITGGTTCNFKLEQQRDMASLKIISDSENVTITNIKISSEKPIYTDTIFVSAVVLLLMFFVIYVKDADEKSEAKALILVLLAVITASYPLFTSYLNYGHDITFHLYRIEGIKDGLLSGQFPVRIHPTHNSGYGYITASVYPELFMYFPAVLRLLGVSLPTAYKALLFAANVASALIMYYSVKSVTQRRYASCVASVLYTLAIWRLMNLYARAALGEGLAMVFFPLVIAGLYHILRGDVKKWYFLALGFSGIFQSHIISTVLCAIFSVIVALVFIKDIFKKERFLALVKALFTTVLLNLWYLVPFVKYYFSLDMAIRQPVVNKEFFLNAIIPTELFNVLSTSFGYSLLLPQGIRGNMSLTLGFGVSACLIFALLYYLLDNGKKHKLKDDKFTKTYFTVGCAFLFAATSAFPWQVLQQNPLINKFAGLVRMPWRFLSITTPLVVFAAAEIIDKYTSEKKRQAVLLVICTVCAIFTVHFGTAFTTNTNVALIKGQSPDLYGAIGFDNEYLVKGTDTAKLTANKYAVSGAEISDAEKNGTRISFKLAKAENGGYVEVPLLYYPGYKAKTESGKKLDVVSGNNNVLRIITNGEKGSVKVYYSGFWYFKAAEIISLLTLVWLAFYGKIKRRREKF